MRQGDLHLGAEFLAQDLLGPKLVSGIHVAEEERNRDSTEGVRAEAGRGRPDRDLVELRAL